MISKKVLVTVFITFFVITIPNSLAWGPNTHAYICEEALSQVDDTTITNIIKQNKMSFYSGLMFPDVTIFYYYSSFKVYQSTHSWSFYKTILTLADTDEEKAFAYGIACHLIQDSVAHNFFVPKQIEQTKIRNTIIHPIVEAIVDDQYYSPGETSLMLQNIDKFLPLCEEALNRDFSSEAYMLRNLVSGGKFYDDAFIVPESEKKVSAVDIAVKIAGNIADVDASEEIELSIEYTKQFYTTGITLEEKYDPSGEFALNRADASLGMLSLGIRILTTLLISVIAISFVVMKRNSIKRGILR